MRITNKVLTKGYLGDLNRNLQNMKKFQEQLSSGKEIRRPSDDPFRVARSMELHTSLMSNERYQTNIDEATGWLDTTDTALGQFNDGLQRIRELTVSGGNSSYSSTEKQAIKSEIEQLKKHLVEVGNSSHDGRYVFGGDKTTTKPFEIDENTLVVTYNGSDNNGLTKEFAPGITLDISVRGNKLSKDPNNTPTSGDVFETIQAVIDKLDSNQSPSGLLGDLDKHIDNVLMLRGEIGAKSNRIEAMGSKNQDENFNITELLSKTEDIDVAEKVMQYKVMENIYNASLQTGAKILQPSLLDFLR